MKRFLPTAFVLPAIVALTPVPAISQEYEFFYNRTEIRQGDIVQVSTRLPSGAKNGIAKFGDTEYRGYVIGGLLSILVGIDMDTEPGEHEIDYKFDNGVERSFSLPVVVRDFGKESLKVASKYTDLDEHTLARVNEEKEMLEKLWATSTPTRLWKSSFLKPTRGELGSPFGLRRFFNDQPRSPHSGLDIKAPPGERVYASNFGKIVIARDLFFTGNTLVIDHGQSVYTIYAHLSAMDVKEGDSVERGQEIGKVGATGRVTGPHLHWGAKVGGARVDPATLPGAVL